ncbi:LuxR C-terminal-related transcriptional regulator [Dactylosporangium sp. CA-092794]|uniref:LuxR C-terminal-related transcriptional regulator n=1 Tax=Dactylosporangium sp. CA-092794 TaxID=3239929 RepID=UPI003D8EAAD0
MIQVAVLDDHPIARRGIEQVLAESAECTVTASAGSAAELAGLIAAPPGPDVIVLDLYHDGDRPCVDAVARFSVASRVLVISAFGRAADVIGAMRAGAAGYITKHAAPDLFVAAVRTVAAGGFALSAQLADLVRAALAEPAAAAPAGGGLSPREQQTLELIASGFTHSQVASRMGVRTATVDTYVERIRAKLGLGNKAELTRAALDPANRPRPA